MRALQMLDLLGRSAPHLPDALVVAQRLGGAPWEAAPSTDLHPLLVPFARTAQGPLGLLVWPGAEPAHPLPVVRQGPSGLHLEATTLEAWLKWRLAELDQAGEDISALCDAVNAQGQVYEVGDLLASGLPLRAFVLMRTGGSPAFFEDLANRHLEKGDTEAALVTADRGCRVASGWARPLAFRADVLHQLGRADEAADAARMALLEPLWTLGARFEPTAELARWALPIATGGFRALAEDESKLPLDRAAHWLDAACAEGLPWSFVREQVAALYEAAGATALARFVRG